jgi:putative nucleotide binding protein
MFKKEEYALVLDFLPTGKAGEARQEPTAQVIGESHFTLLEVVTKPGVDLARLDRVYIGMGERDKIERIKCRLTYAQLTNAAVQEADTAIRRLVPEREQDFVGFINRAGPINIRIHSLELLPNIGKKNLESLLAERDKKPFASFEDIRQRVPHLSHVQDSILARIVQELKAEEKYYLFVKTPPREDEEGERRFDRAREGGYGERRLGDRPRY